MQLGLERSVAVVTGGASGIGWACARLLAQEGCSVGLWDISGQTDDRAAQLRSETKVPVHSAAADITNFSALQRALSQTERVLGPVSHLVHAAAIGSGKFGFPFTHLTPDDWTRVLNVNVLGMANVAHVVGPSMISMRKDEAAAFSEGKDPDKSMVFIASVAGQIGSQTDPPYSASKAANINFAQCLAKDLAPHSIRVNVVNPGMVKTALNRDVWRAWSNLQEPDERRSYEDWAGEKVQRVVPLGRWQEPEDVANMVVFLCSARATQITGQTINVDGGQVMHW